MATSKNKTTRPISTQAGSASDASALAARNKSIASTRKTPAKELVPASPERKPTGEVPRKRLSKAFARPLDRIFKKEALVRDRFTMPASEYAFLVDLKKRLIEQGVVVKKSELVRAGLSVLGGLDDIEVKAILEKLATVT